LLFTPAVDAFAPFRYYAGTQYIMYKPHDMALRARDAHSALLRRYDIISGDIIS